MWDGRKEVLLLPQNDQHLETARILIPRLRAAGIAPRMLLMDGLFHQGLDAADLRDTLRVDELAVRLPRPFYRLDPLRQVVAVIRAVSPMRRAIGRPAVIVIFNDGAMQRLAIRLARSAKIAMLIDGIVSDYATPRGTAHRVRAGLRRIGSRVRSSAIGIVLPSDVGLSPADAVYVLGDHTAMVLAQMGARASRVVATGLPRWPHAAAGPRPSAARRVLYLTAAFAWHAQHAADAAQIRDAATIGSVCRDLGLELVVRVHPRDDPGRWRADGHTVVTSVDESMAESIERADVVLAMVSTGLLEAISLGRIARPVIIADSFDRYARSFVADPMLGAIRSIEGLRDALRGYRDGITADEYAGQESALSPYVAASGDEAATRIVSAIAELTG
jgi:hypothetical protein